MTATPRELVTQALEFRCPARAPRQLWTLPWASNHHPEELRSIIAEFPDDIAGVDGHCREPSPTTGDPCRIGTYVDPWGCVFTNIQDGVVGEVKHPLITDWDSDLPRLRFPLEWLTIDRDAINRDCAAADRFIIGGACPRPFEQLQFIRGTENLYFDLGDPSAPLLDLLARMHSFYCQLLEAWARTDVDGLIFMDDWGSQRALLIRPGQWRELFKPLYRDYVQLAHAAGKKVFMHSDGHILSVIPDLVEIGVDAVNSQLFCMGIENLKPYAGQITFWGEIDRQHLLPKATPAEIDAAVRQVHALLWRKGGCIAQCEFGAGARPENVRQVFASWDALTSTP